MSGDSNGVVVYRATRLTMIEAVRSAHPAPAGRLRRNKRLSHAELADAILATLPGAEPDPLKAVASAERIIAERDEVIAGLRDDLDDRAEQIAGLRDRCDDLFATGRAKEATITELRQQARTSEALIETLRAGLAEAAGENATLREALASPPPPEPILDLAYLEDLTERAGRAEQKLAAMTAVLERFAAPGAITATDRRKAASDALGTAQGADGEAAP